MTSTSPSRLAPELVLQIFKPLDSHHDIVALSATSRKINTIWQLNASTISKAVIPRSIERYDLAIELVDAQLTQSTLQERNAQLVFNASKINKAYSRAGEVYQQDQSGAIDHYCPFLSSADEFQESTKSKREEFACLAYRIGIVAALSNDPPACKASLAKTGLLQLFQIQTLLGAPQSIERKDRILDDFLGDRYQFTKDMLDARMFF
jgi:hypothetical protein